MGQRIYGLTEKGHTVVRKVVARVNGGFRRRRPVNKRRRGTGGGGTDKLVAIVESISAASSAIVNGKAKITQVTVTAKSIEYDANDGEPTYDPANATDVECKWPWNTTVTIAEGKWRLGEVVGGRLHLIDCADRDAS